MSFRLPPSSSGHRNSIFRSRGFSSFYRGKVLDLNVSDTHGDSDPHHENKELLNAYETLREIEQLEKNWNENQADPISSEVVKKVRNTLPLLDKQPEIFPTACNSIQIEYEKENEDYLEFEIFEDTVKCYREIDQHVEESTVDKEEIPKIVREFYA